MMMFLVESKPEEMKPISGEIFSVKGHEVQWLDENGEDDDYKFITDAAEGWYFKKTHWRSDKRINIFGGPFPTQEAAEFACRNTNARDV